MKPSYFIVGGAGFIGSHFVDRLLADGAEVTIFDNFSSGKQSHYAYHGNNSDLRVVRGDAGVVTALQAMAGHETVIHLASNPDISRAVREPTVDFYQGTCLTQNVLEAMRLTGVKKLLYASGSGVYGDRCGVTANEYDGPTYPMSTYGASKLAGEWLIAAYCAMFHNIEAIAFRFANVVGARQTHGVAYDFINRLSENPNRLDVMGDGSQSKPYIHVTDVVEAVLLAHSKQILPFEVYNVSVSDAITVREIAEMVVDVMQLKPEICYGDKPKGWAGDVPVVRLGTYRIRQIGWEPKHTSREAMLASIRAICDPI